MSASETTGTPAGRPFPKGPSRLKGHHIKSLYLFSLASLLFSLLKNQFLSLDRRKSFRWVGWPVKVTILLNTCPRLRQRDGQRWKETGINISTSKRLSLSLPRLRLKLLPLNSAGPSRMNKAVTRLVRSSTCKMISEQSSSKKSEEPEISYGE